jgi:hypothetical protein
MPIPTFSPSLARHTSALVLAVVFGTVPLDAQTTKAPVILFVPGYTEPVTSFTMKHSYFANQRQHFTTLGRDVLYLNTPNDLKKTYRDFQFKQFELGTGNDTKFDSRRTRIDLNANEIKKVLKVLNGMGRKVTIVSHSKGGQDVLHALLTDQTLWPIVTGWLAFTSNFFESKFKVSLPTVPGLPGVAIIRWDWLNRPKEPWCPFRYPKYHVDTHVSFLGFIPRQKYMKLWEADIKLLTAKVPILCAYGAFIPQATCKTFSCTPLTLLDGFNMRIQTQSQKIQAGSKILFRGANDGIVPMRAAHLPGARFCVQLPSDPKGRKGGGVDHQSPAGTDAKNTFWSPPFRNEKTETYISVLEADSALLSADVQEISIPKGGTQRLTINAGKANANKLYWLFGSVTGTSPGVNLLGIHIPLNPDPYTDVVMAASNSAMFTKFKGTLDANGLATASFHVPANLPMPPGFRFHHACLVYDASKIYMASNAALLRAK